MARADQDLRASLVSAGELFGGYHPKMRALHEANADELHRIMQEIGWPTAAKVGEEASSAAWLIAQHAISRPQVMRAARDAIKQTGEYRTELAHLEDRIAVFEGRPQIYGTQFDWDENGNLSPVAIEDIVAVDERRRAMGLGPLHERLAQLRTTAEREGNRGPRDLKAYRAAGDAFAREVGWRDERD